MTRHTEHQRALDVEGAYNVRDLGGYETRDGRMTRWGKYLRSDTLADLSPAGVNTLLEYGVKNIIDLRRSVDLQFRPSPFIGNEAVTYYHQNMVGDVDLEGREAIDRTRGHCRAAGQGVLPHTRTEKAYPPPDILCSRQPGRSPRPRPL